MDKVIRRLSLIENIYKRVKALAEARGIPKNVEEQMHEECEALAWACKELRHNHLVGLILLVGDPNYVKSIIRPVLDVNTNENEIIENYDEEVATFIGFGPEKLFVENIKEYLAPGWEGNTLVEGKSPRWLLCHRYFASCEETDMSKKVIMFDCSVPKEWFEEFGKTKAKDMLIPWMVGIFKAMPWNEAKKVPRRKS